MSYLTRLKLKLIGEINAIPQFLQGNYFTELAGLRGIAIILVLLYHLGINHFLRRYNCWILGRLGVDIFFVLSGFLITTILLKEKVRTQHISLRKFYIRRALRIMPVAYLYLIVIIIINYIFHLNIGYKSFISGFLYLKNLPISGINDTFTEHFWSLSVEEQFYLFFPLLLVITINKTTLIASLSVLGILIFSLLGYHQIGLLFQFRPLTLVCKLFMFLFWEGPFTLFIGSLFAILSFKNVINLEQFKHKSFLSLLLFILAIVFHSNTFYFYTQYLSEFIFDCLIGCIIILSIGSRSLFSKLLNAKWLIWIGTISYSIYIWQQLINLIPLYWVDRHLFGFSHDALFILVDLGRLIAILALASFSYYFIERRFLKLKAHFE
jgi:peptidoglycan/LPS O-acetylase OafA/YrhL